MRAWVAALASTLALAGCLQGEPKYFPDESRSVVALHVNGYQSKDGDARTARIEVTGLGADKEERAFAGRIVITLERQDPAEGGAVTYAPPVSRAFDVTADDFASPTVPVFVATLPASGFEEGHTYRVGATATIGGRALEAPTALFYWA
ncbi:MAG TPA: hypothetical protein VHH36_04715 [Candidatus Thermoplasmatota archaeon]|nr:hypothetical protein [Candidatus Thermoplasmatota archaeon]